MITAGMAQIGLKGQLVKPAMWLWILLLSVLFLIRAYAQRDDSASAVTAETINIVKNDTLDTESGAAGKDSVTHPAGQNNSFYNPVSQEQVRPIYADRRPFWLFLIFMLQFGLIAYLRTSFTRETEAMIKGVMSLNIARQLYRDQEQSTPVSALLYNLNFALSGGIFLFLLNKYTGWMRDDTFVSFLFFLWAVIAVYSLRFGTFKLVSLIFPFGDAVNQYSFNFFLVQKMMGLMLVPFNLLIAYSPDYLRPAIVIIALAIVLLLVAGRSMKGLAIARNLIAGNAFHFFVYICTLEIAPVCILIKVVVDG